MVEPRNIPEAVLQSKMIWVQYVYFIVNFLFVIVGTLLITMASVIGWVPEEYTSFTNWEHEPIRVLKLIGIALIILSLIANLASIKQTFLLFATYGGLVLALLIVEITFGIKAFVTYHTSSSIIAHNMLGSLQYYYHSSKNNWDYIQHYMGCCGVHNVSDWAVYYVDGPEITVDGHTYSIPYSCCINFKCTNIHSSGCLNVVNDYVSKILLIILGIVISIAIIKIFLLVLSCVLTVSSTDADEETPEANQDTLQERLVTNEDLNLPSTSNI